MVRSSWFFPGFYEASGNLDLQSNARNNHVEACRPRAFVLSSLYVAVQARMLTRVSRASPASATA